MQQVMPAFQKRSARDVVLRQRVGNIPILSIMTLWPALEFRKELKLMDTSFGTWRFYTF